MGFKSILKSLIPSKEDKHCAYIIDLLFNLGKKYKTCKFTNVTPGLAALLKREHGGTYSEVSQIYCMIPEKDTYGEISCKMKELDEFYAKEKVKRDR